MGRRAKFSARRPIGIFLAFQMGWDKTAARRGFGVGAFQVAHESNHSALMISA
jgi:hypothetical protein